MDEKLNQTFTTTGSDKDKEFWNTISKVPPYNPMIEYMYPEAIQAKKIELLPDWIKENYMDRGYDNAIIRLAGMYHNLDYNTGILKIYSKGKLIFNDKISPDTKLERVI